MGNCWSNDVKDGSNSPDNEEPHTPLVRSVEIPQITENSLDKIKVGLSLSPKKLKTENTSSQSIEDQETDFLLSRERSRLEKERLELELEDKFRKAEEEKKRREEKKRQDLEKQRQEIERIQERESLDKIAKELENEKIQQREIELENEKIVQQQNEIIKLGKEQEEKLTKQIEDTRSAETNGQEDKDYALQLFLNLPKEIYRICLSFLPKEERFKVRLLSRFWKDLVDKSGTVVFILNDITRSLSVPNIIVDDRSLETMGEEGLREFLGKNTTICHILFRGSNWSPSKAARVLINNATITEDAAFRVSAHCATEEFQDLETIRKRNLSFVPCRLALSQNPTSFESVYFQLIQTHTSSIAPILLCYASITGMADLVDFLLKLNIDPLSPPSSEFKDSAFILALRKNEKKIIETMENHFGGPLIGWCGAEIERNEVENMLKNKPVGTFLTRYSSRVNSYVISHNLPINNEAVPEHMNQIFPQSEGKVKVINKQDGSVFYDSFPDYVYRMILRDGMYCLYPVTSKKIFEAIPPK